MRSKEPSVLVVLVARDGARWLRDCLLALSRQTHPRLGVIAVDNGSRDGSRDLLERVLGASRVISLPHNPGFPAAVQVALQHEAAERGDYVLMLHDDTLLEPDAVERLVEAAERIDGVGVVGPKIVDWDDPRILRDVGQSTDRFGYPYSPLEEGELDQGQYDRIREVLFVSSAAMLVSHSAWRRTGPPDERLAPYFDDLDFCWRARLAGFRVLMSPSARARHRGAMARGERGRVPRHGRERYHAERASLAAMLKNYGILSLAWVLPMYVVQAVGKAVLWALTRRLDEAMQLISAWGWNLVHIPSTIRRRARAQSVRAVPDRLVRRYMAPTAIRLRRWGELGMRALGRGERPAAPRAIEEEEELELPSIGARTLSLARAHPVATAWVVAAIVAAFAYRPLVGGQVLRGGVLPTFPTHPGDFLRQLVSGVQTTGLGGTHPASPALAVLGGLSYALFGSTQLALKALLILLPPIAGLTLYRLAYRQSGHRGGSVAAAACYALSAALLWAFSEGRIGLLVALAVLPALVGRLEEAFSPAGIRRPARFAIEAGMLLAVGAAFFPGIALAFALVAVLHLVIPDRRGRTGRGLLVTAGAAAAGFALVFPFGVAAAGRAGADLALPAGQPDFASLARLVLAPAAGSWSVAWFLPAAALLAFTVVDEDARRPALRYLVGAIAAPYLAWAAAAGYLPGPLANPPAYVAVGTLSCCVLVALGLSSVFPLSRHAFGYRQVSAVVLAALLGGGLALQAVQAGRAGWELGPRNLPPAWPVVADSNPVTPFRVLWLGRAENRPFPAPGGDPSGEMAAGATAVRYAITSRTGVSALDIGRRPEGDGYGYLERALAAILSGTTSHGGSLLGPLGIRFVVSEQGDLPDEAFRGLDAQVDLNLVPAGGLTIFRNARALPEAWMTGRNEYVRAASDGGARTVSLPVAQPARLRPVAGGFDLPGSTRGASVVVVAEQFARGWRLIAPGREVPAERAFGWALGFRPEGASAPVEVRYGDQWQRTAELAALGVLWLAALWITRKPARR